jgi:hypothetical protein
MSDLASLHAMRGEITVARELALRGRAMFADLGAAAVVNYVTIESIGWYVERLGGDWNAAERELRRGYDGLAAMNETGVLSSAAGCLAMCMLAQGRDAEAAEFVSICAERAAKDDVFSQAYWRCARAMLHARRGEAAEAEALAAEATELVRPTDALELQGNMLIYLAGVLHLGGKPERARAAADTAVGIFDRKEHLVGAAQARELRAELDVEVAAR